MYEGLADGTVERVLRYLSARRCVTVSDLERGLGLSRSEVESVVGLLLSEGIISEAREELQCGRCPLTGKCTLKYYRVRVYRVSR